MKGIRPIILDLSLLHDGWLRLSVPTAEDWPTIFDRLLLLVRSSAWSSIGSVQLVELVPTLLRLDPLYDFRASFDTFDGQTSFGTDAMGLSRILVSTGINRKAHLCESAWKWL